MAYNVIITSLAKSQLERYISYTISELNNKQAAKAIRDDAQETKKRLSIIAQNLPLCEDKILARNGYRRILFENHKFFMVYRIKNDTVIVDAMYHELQDYESVFVHKMNLI